MAPVLPSTIPSSLHFETIKRTKGYQIAYIVFKNKSSLKSATQMSYSDIRVLFPSDSPSTPVGLSKWCRECIDASRPPNPETLQKEIDSYMARYDRQLAKKVEEDLKREEVPDDDGWVTVSRYGKNKGTPRTEKHETKTKLKDKKRNQEKELLHFYAYQIRESKKEYVAQLRQRFEEDKQKIVQMKAARKFRPY
jgi:ribosomal RNA-processing protein 7